jgi:superfamily II DNA or RNA helicase
MTSTTSPNQFIIEAPDWNSFFQSLSNLDASTTDKGHIFDRVTQLYLQASPIYQIKLKHVWLLRQVPPRVRKLLNLPHDDFGIDQIAETFDGEFWSIQSKFRSDIDSALTFRELSTFSTLSFVKCNDIKLALVSHTSMLPIRNRALLGDVSELGLEKWSTIDQELWDVIRNLAKGKIKTLKTRDKRDHQITAVKKVEDYFSKAENTRGRIIMPCGSGKSLVGFWAAETLNAKSVLIAVPSLYLIGQTIKDWAREFLANEIKPDWLVVCSDERIAELNKDEFVGGVYELGVDSTTNTEEIKEFISKNSDKKKIIYTTYHSSKRLIDAASSVGFQFDLTICDEAHKTVGYREKPFAALVSDQRFKSKHRIFMTATEKVLRNKNDDVLSMDEDSNDYGETIYFLSHGEAISSNPPIISDYRIVTLEIPEVRIKKLMNENEYLFEKGGEFEKAEAKDVGSCLALIDLFEKHSCRKGISFHSSIKRSEDFKKLCSKISELLGYDEIGHYTVSSKLPPGKRVSVIDDFDQSKKALITNARCLNEGVDLPAVDSVIFADPKTSIVDIVQASGRALRLHEEKEFGFILIPLIVPENLDFEEFALESNFRHIARTITALSIYDNRIVEQFSLLDKGVPGGGGGPVIIEEVVQTGINIKQFKQSLFAKIWSNVGRANWRTFKKARAYAITLDLKNSTEWKELYKKGELPKDLPSAPHQVYKEHGWISYGDFLGTGYVYQGLREYKSYEDAKEYLKSFKFKGQKQFWKYARAGKLPADIPSDPFKVYKNKGWKGYGDFLSTGNVSTRLMVFRTFKEARKYARSLGFKGESQWRKHTKTKEFPEDIPANPWQTYNDKGWLSMGDWLGTGIVATSLREFKPFKEARKYARSLGIKTRNQWEDHGKAGLLPSDIPYHPERTYKEKGWISTGDWLGTRNVQTNLREYRPFEEAREYARSLNVNSAVGWYKLSKDGKLPKDITSVPHRTYKGKGWKSWRDFLGSKGKRFKDKMN